MKQKRMTFLCTVLVLCAMTFLLPQSGGCSGLEEAPVEAARTADIPTVDKLQGTDGDKSEMLTLFSAIAKVAGSLGIVVGLMFLVVYMFKKVGMGKTGISNSSLIRVMDTRMIAPKKYVAVLQLADEFVAVGVTDESINLLTRLEPTENLQEIARVGNERGEAPLSQSFTTLLNKAVKAVKNKD